LTLQNHPYRLSKPQLKSEDILDEIISKFIEHMRAFDCAPADTSVIVADDKPHYYQIDGDKRGVKKGQYCLLIDDMGGLGWCKNYREGKSHGFSSKVKKEWTEEEKAAWKKSRDEKKSAAELESARLRKEAVARCNELMKRAKPATTHPYLTRKGIKSTGIYELRDFQLADHMPVISHGLIIPAYKDGKLSTMQAIDEQGGKWFMPEAEIDGSYGVIKGADMDVLYIVEGVATGASVYEAVGRTVVIAFNAGNLKPVAKAMKEKYPQAQIVIAADNDAWRFKSQRPKAVKDIKRDEVAGDDARWQEWLDAGYLENKGVIEARQAAVAIGGASVLYPEFEGWHKDKPTDWNDAHKILGLDEIRIRLEAISTDRAIVKPEPPLDAVVSNDDSPTFSQEPPLEWLMTRPPIEAYEDEALGVMELYDPKVNDTHQDVVNWRGMLQFDDKGKLKTNSLNNVQIILEHSPKFRDMFAYDEFAHEKILVQCPDWENPKTFKPRPITDEDNTWLAMSLEKHGLTSDMGKIKKILDAVIVKKRRNPAREYFNSLQWDGIERLNKWLTYYAGAEYEDADYLAAIGTKWLVACVSRVFEPATKFDHVLILEGDQGARKSTMLKELATIRGRSYFDDTIKVSDLGEDKTVPKLQGVLIIELAEMAGLRKSDVDKLKQQITITEDRLVRKYANEASRFPRQFVMAGTINPVNGYLEDPSGNRRFLPVRVGRKIDIEAIARDKEQLWAEAVHLYRAKYPLWIDDDIMDKLKIVQISREVISPWLPDIEQLVRGKEFISNQLIWETLGIEKSRRTNKDFTTISKIMVGLGYKPTRKRLSGEREYGWHIEPQEVLL